MQGLQASKAPYEQLTKDALMNQKLKEVKKQNDIEDILSKRIVHRNNNWWARKTIQTYYKTSNVSYWFNR